MLDERRLSEIIAGERDLAAAYLFGSRAKGAPRRDSDIDVALIFREGADEKRRFEVRCAVSERVARALGVERADVVDLETAPPLLAREVLRGGKLLFSRDEPRRVRVVARQTMRYIDTAPLRRTLDEATFKRVREGSFGRLP